MKLITILFLCSRLLASLTQESVTQEIDCNDEDVFKAVDIALKTYNSNQSGNQFVLYRVTEVTKTVGSQTFYSFKYQIKEGDCSVHSNKTWQDCDYKGVEQAATGECTATVGMSESEKFSVATQTCQITPAAGPVETDEYACLGCVHPISTESSELEPILRHAIQYFNNNTDHSHLFALGKVKNAERQVVAGWRYEITYSIVQTDCPKKNFPLLTPDCKSISNGDTGECTDKALVDPQQSIAFFLQNCSINPGGFGQPHLRCVGCPTEIPVDSPGLKEALTHAIAKLNAENNETFYFKIDTVKRATSQVVAGVKYSVEFIARETICPKGSNTEFNESCEVKDSGKSLSCNANVYVVPWEKKIYPTVNCQPHDKDFLVKRPPGFSPFRKIEVQKTGETTVSPPYTSMATVQDEQRDPEKEEEPTRGHGWGHGKKIKHGLGHGHKNEYEQGHGHQRGPGLGHGPQKQNVLGHGHHQHGPDHGHQSKLDFDLEHQRGHGLDHGHQMGHDLAHGQKHKHGHGHGKHKNKDKNNGKLNDQRPEHLASSSEDSATSSIQTREKTKGPTSIPPPAHPGITVTFSDFQDSDLIEAETSLIPPTPTEDGDDWIPDIQIEPNSLSFKLIPDFPETASPKCPGRPWKTGNGKNPIIEMRELPDFDLAEAVP